MTAVHKKCLGCGDLYVIITRPGDGFVYEWIGDHDDCMGVDEAYFLTLAGERELVELEGDIQRMEDDGGCQ